MRATRHPPITAVRAACDNLRFAVAAPRRIADAAAAAGAVQQQRQRKPSTHAMAAGAMRTLRVALLQSLLPLPLQSLRLAGHDLAKQHAAQLRLRGEVATYALSTQH
jgi:hypothetical protein